MTTRKGNTGLWSISRVNVSVESRDGSLPLTTPKGCLNHTTRPRVRDSARSPPGHIRHIRNPTIFPRSYALPFPILYLIPPHTPYPRSYTQSKQDTHPDPSQLSYPSSHSQVLA